MRLHFLLMGLYEFMIFLSVNDARVDQVDFLIASHPTRCYLCYFLLLSSVDVILLEKGKAALDIGVEVGALLDDFEKIGFE